MDWDYCADVCELNYLMVRAIFLGGARVQRLILFQLILSKAVEYCLQYQQKAIAPLRTGLFSQNYIHVGFRKFCRSKNKRRP